jgi:hypothetical protein
MQVWNTERLIGWLEGAPRHDSRVFVHMTEVTEVLDLDGFMTPAPVSTRILPTQMRKAQIDYYDLKNTRDLAMMLAKYHVPEDAEQYRDPMRDAIIFGWKVLVVKTLDDEEWIFDHDGFEPVDDPKPDRDTAQMGYF